MKRDPGLQTKILQRLEEAGPKDEVRSLEGYTSEEFCYYARLLHRKGWIDIVDFAHLTDPLACVAVRLTPSGHDLLDRARTEWQRKAKSAISRGAQLTLETVLRGMLDHMIR